MHLAAEVNRISFDLPLFLLLAGFGLVMSAFSAAVNWRIFTKAEQPGWHAIVPFLNVYTLLKIVGRPGWWMLLMIIPVVGLVVAVVVIFDLAQVFGKGTGFAFGLLFLGFVFFPILAFGDATYTGGNRYAGVSYSDVYHQFGHPTQRQSWAAGQQPSLPAWGASSTAAPDTAPGPAPSAAPPAGWFADPTGVGHRYWDGTRWTEHRAP